MLTVVKLYFDQKSYVQGINTNKSQRSVRTMPSCHLTYVQGKIAL